MPNTQSTRKEESAEDLTSLEGLKQSFVEFKQDIAKLLHDAISVGTDGAGVVKEGAASAMDQLNDKVQEMKKRGTKTVKKIEDQIEENPLVSAAIAFGVGYIVAKLLSRRD